MKRRRAPVGLWIGLLVVAGCVSTETPSASPAGPTSSPSPATITSAPSPSIPVSPVPSATGVPTIQPTLTPSTAPSPTGSPAALEIQWRLSQRDNGFSELFDTGEWPTFHSGVVFRNRFFIAAERYDREENELPYVWSSQDGLSWEPTRVAEYGHVRSLVAGPAGLLAVVSEGYYSHDGALWLSTDGSAWEQITDPDLGPEPAISHVAATAAGYVAFGSPAFKSADGRDWQAIETNSTYVLLGEGVRALAVSGETILAVTAGYGGHLHVWLSTNMTDWTGGGSLPHSPVVDSPAAAAGPLGWIVWDQAALTEKSQRMWLSPDGQVWDEVVQPPAPVSDIFVDSVGFIAVGYLLTGGCAINPAEIQGFTWTSRNGHTWTEMTREGWEFNRVDHLFRNGRKVIGLGVSYSDRTDESVAGAVWTAQLPQVPPTGPAPTPAPTPTEEPNPGCG